MNISSSNNLTSFSNQLYKDCLFLASFSQSEPGSKIEILPPIDEANHYGNMAISGKFRTISKIFGYGDSFYVFQKLNDVNREVGKNISELTVDKTFKTFKLMEKTKELLTESEKGLQHLKNSYSYNKSLNNQLENIIQNLTHHIEAIDQKIKDNRTFDLETNEKDNQLYFQFQIDSKNYSEPDPLIDGFYLIERSDPSPEETENSFKGKGLPQCISEYVESLHDVDSSEEDEDHLEEKASKMYDFLNSVYFSKDNDRLTFGAEDISDSEE